jgi:hypothetical protein
LRLTSRSAVFQLASTVTAQRVVAGVLVALNVGTESKTKKRRAPVVYDQRMTHEEGAPLESKARNRNGRMRSFAVRENVARIKVCNRVSSPCLFPRRITDAYRKSEGETRGR